MRLLKKPICLSGYDSLETMDNNSNESPNPNRVPPATSSSPSSSTPFVQESPFYAFMKNLSPIKSDKIARYMQRFSTSNIPIPQQPVFASPQMDLQRLNGPLKREENDALCFETHGEVGAQRKEEPITIVQDDVQLCSPSVCVDDYFADPLQIEDTMDAFNLHAQSEDGEQKILTNGLSGTEQTSTKTSDCRQFSGGSANQDAGGKCGKAEAGAGSRSFPLLLSGSGKSGDFAEDSRPFSKGFIKENEHLQCGIRRYLHFETTTVSKNTGNGTDDMNNVNLPARLQASGSTTNFESLVSCNDHPRGFSSSQQDCPSSQNVICRSFSFPYDPFRFPPSPTYEEARQLGTELSVPGQSANNMTGQWEKIMPGSSFSAANDTSSVSIPTAVGVLYTLLQDGPHERRATSITGSIVPLANNVHCPSIQHLIPFDLQTPLCENLSSSGDTNIVEELNQESPQTSRKRTKQDNEIDGCKRCNCKRSKCLKLYCECFAAGLYCLDNCSCENCFNKLEYEDTVLDTRKQIELRNPLAFAPKVVKHTARSPANTMEEAKQTTPSSARHKRGCNCKKSKCVKKYCECYQANVGCSDGCRCGGCDNPFGRKAEFLPRRIENRENQSQQKACNGAGRRPRLSPTWGALADITNLTPSPLPSLGAVASGAGNKLLQANGCYSLVGPSHMQCTLTEFTPESGGSLQEFASANPFHDPLNDDPTLQIPENTSTTQTAAKFGSPNQEREGPRQNLSHGLLSRRKFSLRAMPSFPPLSPYRNKSPDVMHQIDGTTNTGLIIADENVRISDPL